MEDLISLREKINEIDKSMLQLFKMRMEVVGKVAEYKRKNSMEVLDVEREEQMLNKHLENIEEGILREQLKEFLQSLMCISRNAQENILKQK